MRIKLLISVWLLLGVIGCSHSTESRTPAAVVDVGLSSERYVHEFKDYAFSDEIAAAATEIVDRQFTDALADIDSKSEQELRVMLRDESKRMDTVLVENSAAMDEKSKKIIVDYQAELQRIADGDAPKEELRATTYKGWRVAWAGVRTIMTSLIYAQHAVAGSVGLPVTMAAKFIYGVSKSNRLDRTQEDAMYGDRTGDGIVNGAFYPVLPSVFFWVASGTSALSPFFVATIVNAAVYMVVKAGCHFIDMPRANKFCANLVKIEEFFSRVSDKAAYAGADMSIFLAKMSPVLRKKDVVSDKVCKHDKRSVRVANRVMIRHENAIKAIPGVQAVSVGTSANHPVSKTCGSLVVQLKAGILVDAVEPVFGRVIDGVYVDYK